MIGRQVAAGGMMMVGGRLITRVVDMSTMLVLAHLLRPNDFGLVAIGMSLVLVAETAMELPLNQVLVRLDEISSTQYDTAFTLGLMRGGVLSLIVIIAAWPFARFYGEPRLFTLICVLSLAPVSRSLVSPRLAHYQKDMSFWRDFVLELTGKIVGFAVAVGTGIATGSYWSIAAGTVAVPVTNMIVSYGLAPYRPRLALSDLPTFTGFVGWMSVAQIVNAVNYQIEKLLLGKIKSPSQLGLFTTSSDIATMPFLAFFGPIIRPLLAAFSRLREDKQRLARSYQNACTAIVTLGLPLLVGESLVAEPAIRLVLGPNWLGAVDLLRWLSLSTIPALLAMPAIPLMMSLGNTKLVLQRNLFEFSAKVPVAVVGGIIFGFAGVIASRFASELVAGLFCMCVVKKHLGLSIREQLLNSWRSVVGTLLMVPPVLMCAEYLGSQVVPYSTLANFALPAAVGAAVYVTSLLGLWFISGCPHGVEAMAWTAITRVVRRGGHRDIPA